MTDPENELCCIVIKAFGFLDLDGDTVCDVLAVGYPRDWTELGPAMISWRLGLGNRQFGAVSAYYEGEPGDQFYAFDAADLDWDGDQDLFCASYSDNGAINNSIFFYDSEIGSLVGGGDPFDQDFYMRPALFAMLNDDSVWDALVTWQHVGPGVYKTVAYRGMNETTFEPVQELLYATQGVVAELTAPDGPDYLSVTTYGGERPVAVWPNLVHTPAGAEGTIPPDRSIVSVCPNVASSPVRIQWEGLAGEKAVVRIMDINGRAVRTLVSRMSPVTWDLRDRNGRLVESGIYWVVVRGETRPLPTARATILR